MNKVMKYLSWNAMIIGSLVLASVFNIKAFIVVLTVFFSIEALTCATIVFTWDQQKDDTKAKLNGLIGNRFWTIPFEIGFAYLAFYLNHSYIGTCMVITLSAYVYILFALMEWNGQKHTVDDIKPE